MIEKERKDDDDNFPTFFFFERGIEENEWREGKGMGKMEDGRWNKKWGLACITL